MPKRDLEERLQAFVELNYLLCLKLANKYQGKILANQLFKSSCSIALNYAEAQGAESRKDFIHKLKICQKEILETRMCLKLTGRVFQDIVNQANIKECEELLAIFITIIKKSKTYDQ